MAHPYSTTIPGLVSTLRQLRTVFPSVVTAETLKKWSIASNNEGPVLVVLRFLGLIDEEGKKNAANAKVFVEHDDAEFAKKFEGLVKAAYSDLFETFGDAAWSLDKNKLIGFFRTADESSARVGEAQAQTFSALAGLAGHGPAPKSGGEKAPKTTAAAKAKPAAAAGKKTASQPPPPPPPILPPRESVGPSVTLRVEINLPVSEDQAVYDNIFKSLRTHLLDA